MRLTRIVAELRQQLKEREAELEETRRQTQLRLEAQFKEEQHRLEGVLMHLQGSCSDLQASQELQAMNEQQRKATLTRQLAKAKYDIETLENSLVACNRTMSLIEMQQNFVALTQSALLQYEQKTYIRSSPIIPVINMKAMEVAVELYELLNFLAAEKTQRVQSINKTRESRTMLLEFCVDTQDPNAHKHEQILSELNVMRDHLLQDVDSLGAMILQLASSCSGMQLTNAERPPDVSCNNTLRCLQERAPQFFELMNSSGAYIKSPGKLQADRAGLSRYVKAKRHITSPIKPQYEIAAGTHSTMSPSTSLDASSPKLLEIDDIPAEGLLLNSPPKGQLIAAAAAPADAAQSISRRRRRLNPQNLNPGRPVEFHRTEFDVQQLLP
jgi:hypothetical protein